MEIHTYKISVTHTHLNIFKLRKSYHLQKRASIVCCPSLTNKTAWAFHGIKNFPRNVDDASFRNERVALGSISGSLIRQWENWSTKAVKIWANHEWIAFLSWFNHFWNGCPSYSWRTHSFLYTKIMDPMHLTHRMLTNISLSDGKISKFTFLFW